MSTEAAIKANATRRVDADIAILRDYFNGVPKCAARDRVVDFLVQFTPPGGKVYDLLGPGYSAAEEVARGLSVVAVEDLSWSRIKLDKDRPRAEAAAGRIANHAGAELVIDKWANVVPRMTPDDTANYDPCGNLAGPVAGDIRAMARQGLRAFAVTILHSRVDGMKGMGVEQYDLLARVVLRKEAYGYRLWDSLKYQGTAGVPMGVYLLVRWRRGEEQHIKSPLDLRHKNEAHRAQRANPEYREQENAQKRTPEAHAKRKALDARNARQREARAFPEGHKKQVAWARKYRATPEGAFTRAYYAATHREERAYYAATHREERAAYARAYRARKKAERLATGGDA